MMWDGFVDSPKLEQKSKDEQDEEFDYLMSLYDYEDVYDGNAEFVPRPESMGIVTEDRRNLNAISLYACIAFVILGLCFITLLSSDPPEANSDDYVIRLAPAFIVGIFQGFSVIVYIKAQWEKAKEAIV